MKAVMLSVRPQWCELIANGQKTVEVRKNKPKLETPFKCYIYCTSKPEKWLAGIIGERKPQKLNGKIIGEFVCDDIRRFDVPYPAYQNKMGKSILTDSCCTYFMLHRYAYHDDLYGWHISALQIYGKPKELNEFKKYNRKCYYSDLGLATPNCKDCKSCQLNRAPESWCYVETLS